MSKNFEQTVKEMSAKEIIMSMAEGLQMPAITISMHTYGEFIDGICYGCAATNTICKINGKTFTAKDIENEIKRAKFIGSDIGFLVKFERAINELRSANIGRYNEYAESIGIEKIKHTGIILTYLNRNYTAADFNNILI